MFGFANDLAVHMQFSFTWAGGFGVLYMKVGSNQHQRSGSNLAPFTTAITDQEWILVNYLTVLMHFVWVRGGGSAPGDPWASPSLSGSIVPLEQCCHVIKHGCTQFSFLVSSFLITVICWRNNKTKTYFIWERVLVTPRLGVLLSFQNRKQSLAALILLMSLWVWN